MYCGSRLTTMKLPKALATLPPVSPRSSKEENGHVVEEKGTDTEIQFTILSVQTPERQEDVTKRWKEVKATVLGNHEIPDLVAKRIPVRVSDATLGSDICFDGNSSIRRLTVEYTLSTVREGHVTDALVVNITGVPVRIRHRLLLGKYLAYNLKVVPFPLEFPTACVSSVHKSSVDTELGQAPTLRSAVNVVDYPEMKHSLLELLERFRDVTALPGESLGVM